METELNNILKSPLSCEDGSFHTIDENTRRDLAKRIRQLFEPKPSPTFGGFHLCGVCYRPIKTGDPEHQHNLTEPDEALLLTDEEIKVAKAEAERLSWTHKTHPSFEKEKFLIEAQLSKALKAGQDESIETIRDDFNRGYGKGRQEGIREVKEWGIDD